MFCTSWEKSWCVSLCHCSSTVLFKKGIYIWSVKIMFCNSILSDNVILFLMCCQAVVPWRFTCNQLVKSNVIKLCIYTKCYKCKWSIRNFQKIFIVPVWIISFFIAITAGGAFVNVIFCSVVNMFSWLKICTVLPYSALWFLQNVNCFVEKKCLIFKCFYILSSAATVYIKYLIV